jgi:hypothetical protein
MAGAAGMLAIALAGCELPPVVSVEPVVPEAEAILDDRLVGTWQAQQQGPYVVSLAGEGDATYLVDGAPARLGRLGEHLVLEFLPGTSQLGALSLPVHYLVVLKFVPEGLGFGLLDEVRLHEFLQARQSDLAYRIQPRRGPPDRDYRLVLYDSTARVRSELAAYLARPDVLEGAPILVRIEDASLGKPKPPVTPPCFEVSPWPEADRLFSRDPRLRGFAIPSTADLGGGRILWTFPASWVDPDGQADTDVGSIDETVDSIAIQSGTDPASAQLAFHWRRAEDGTPTPFFAVGEGALVSDGVRVRDRLVLFFDQERVHWAALMVENPDEPPATWRMQRLETPENPLGIVLGEAAVLQHDGYVYAFGPEYAGNEGLGVAHQLYAARWPDAKVYAGELGEPEWWAGEKLGWLPDSPHVHRFPLFEYWDFKVSIHFDAVSGRFLAVHARRGESMEIVMRAAPALVGPWSEARFIHRPVENHVGEPGEFSGPYDARAHPQLTGADLVLSYSTADPWMGLRFLRLARCQHGESP